MNSKLYERITFVLPKDEVKRLKVNEGKELPEITVDVHGMKCVQVRKLLNNLINVVRTAIRIIVIHGFNHGQEIKNMLADDFYNDHIVNHFADVRNQGVTYILTAA